MSLKKFERIIVNNFFYFVIQRSIPGQSKDKRLRVDGVHHFQMKAKL